ncbi:MAG: hypothetical protein ACRCZB_02775 [Bacteroidales bacterium]
MNALTNRQYWENYWTNYQYKKLPKSMIFDSYIPKLKGVKNFIEIGGFPGTVSAYAYHKICKDVSLLDFYIDKTMVNTVEKTSNIPNNSIICIEHDFFTYNSTIKYDVVFSLGFIEHFENTQEILKKHATLLSDTGKLLILLPNFLGLNGFVQYLFDKETLKAHNLKSMHISFLKDCLNSLPLKNLTIKYSRKPMLWLEPKPQQSKILRGIIKLLSKALKLLPIPCKLLSPYIIIYAEKQ